MHLTVTASLLFILNAPQAIVVPDGLEEMRIERVVARRARELYSGQALGFEDIAQEFVTPHTPTGPRRATYRTPEHIASILRDLRASEVQLTRAALCDSDRRTGCVQTVIRIGRPVVTGDSATAWLYAYEGSHSEVDQLFLLKRGNGTWFVVRMLETRETYSGENATAPWLALVNPPVMLDTANTPSDSIGRQYRFRGFDQVMVRGQGETSSVDIQSEVRLYLDCAARRVRDIELRLFSARDSQWNVLPVPEAGTWKPFEQHWLAKVVPMDTVCAALRRVGKA